MAEQALSDQSDQWNDITFLIIWSSQYKWSVEIFF